MKDTYIRIRLSLEDKLALQAIVERDNTSMTGVITKWLYEHCDNSVCDNKSDCDNTVNQVVRTNKCHDKIVHTKETAIPPVENSGITDSLGRNMVRVNGMMVEVAG